MVKIGETPPCWLIREYFGFLMKQKLIVFVTGHWGNYQLELTVKGD